MDANEETLAGGHMNAVSRTGERVLRAAGPWSETIQRLLAHLRAKGINWVPEPLGFDEDGREVLGFIEGEVPHETPDWLWSDALLVEVAQALRALHEASSDFDRTDARWQFEWPTPHEVICHGDFAPYNCAFVEGRFAGLFDFDTSAPGSRLWDLAYTAYRFVPLLPSKEEGCDLPGGEYSPFPWPRQLARLKTFLKAYAAGDDRFDYSVAELLAQAAERLAPLAEFSEAHAEQSGQAELATHAAMYRAHADWLRERAKPQAARSCDIFCKVIDNFGDIGVCWRLARQLAAEHGLAVRLFVDDLASFQRLAPSLDERLAEQALGGIRVLRWDKNAGQAEPADLVIEAFACDPPEAYVEAMARRERPPVWINLEYLSAEDWVEGLHALPSPHPRLPLTKHFFFPGFTEKTGSLIREANLVERLRAFGLNARAQREFWLRLGVEPPEESALKVSLFAYENAAVPGLLDAWAKGGREIFCAVTESRILPQVRDWAERNPDRGRLRLAFLPFLSQGDYDRLLAACDLNFVRGEDSFVRAQWAAKPLIWHIYRQEDNAHRPKLEAFLARYAQVLGADEEVALRDFWQAWEGEKDPGERWPALLEALPSLTRQAEKWAQKLVAREDLTSKLLIFCGDLLQSGPL